MPELDLVRGCDCQAEVWLLLLELPTYCHTSLSYPAHLLASPGLWIRIHCLRIRIQLLFKCGSGSRINKFVKNLLR